MARIIGIVSGKGGVGKTTLALNLGAAMAGLKKDVAVMDCNLTASHLGLHLGMYNTPATINKVLREELSVHEALYPHPSGMKVLPASLSMKELVGVDASRIGDTARKLSEGHDFVILDASPGFGREAMAAMRACDELVFVTTPHLPSVMDVVRFHEIMDDMDAKPIGIALNMAGKDRYEMTRSEIEYFTDMPVIASVPYDTAVRRSLHKKTPVVTEHPKSRAGREIVKFAHHLSGEPYVERSLLAAIRAALRR